MQARPNRASSRQRSALPSVASRLLNDLAPRFRLRRSWCNGDSDFLGQL